MVTQSERKAYGLLGRPPDSVLFNKAFLSQWMELELKARDVVRVRDVYKREQMARQIEMDHHRIIAAAEKYQSQGAKA